MIRRAPLAAARGARRLKRALRNVRRRARRARRRTGGQAMIEYAIVTMFILMAAGGVAFAFLPELIDAYQVYFDSFYFVLNLPVP